MVQAYDAVPVLVEHDDADDGRGLDHEGSALLGGRASSVGLVRNRAQKEGHATLTSSAGNLANTIIGSGELHGLTATSRLYYPRRIFLLTGSYVVIVQACSPFLGYVSFPRYGDHDGSSCPR
jgi:hypothetical protein